LEQGEEARAAADEPLSVCHWAEKNFRYVEKPSPDTVVDEDDRMDGGEAF